MKLDIADLKEKFDISKLIADLRNSAEQPSADPRMISTLGVVGALLVVLAVAVKGWDMWSGWTTAEASAAGHEMIEQLNAAVAPYRGSPRTRSFWSWRVLHFSTHKESHRLRSGCKIASVLRESWKPIPAG